MQKLLSGSGAADRAAGATPRTYSGDSSYRHFHATSKSQDAAAEESHLRSGGEPSARSDSPRFGEEHHHSKRHKEKKDKKEKKEKKEERRSRHDRDEGHDRHKRSKHTHEHRHGSPRSP